MAVSAAQLAALQAAVNRTFDQACTIQRDTRALVARGDGAGGFTEQLSTVATTVCHVNQPTLQLMQNYDYLIGPLSAWLVRLPIGANVQKYDTLLIGGQALRVQVILAPRSNAVALRVLAAEIQSP